MRRGGVVGQDVSTDGRADARPPPGRFEEQRAETERLQRARAPSSRGGSTGRARPSSRSTDRGERRVRRRDARGAYHDLRRTAVRSLERAGVWRSVVTSLTGHLTESVYRRYASVSQADQREQMAKLVGRPDKHSSDNQAVLALSWRSPRSRSR